MLNVQRADDLVDVSAVLDAVVNFENQLGSVAQLQGVAQLTAEPAAGR